MTFARLAAEQHDTLEGIPEPSETPGLVGHEAAAVSIAMAYRSHKLHHALLLSGPRGIGKSTFAFHVARHLLAHPEAQSAPERIAPADPSSQLFRQIASGAHLAVLHLTRSFNDKTKKFMTVLGVDEIRRVGRFLSMTAHDGSYRVVIVDAADDMNASAANALLKRLEEPPERTLFLLISHSSGRLLPTIRSRCQTVRLAPLSDAEVQAALAGLGVTLEGAGTAELLARAGGSVRSAIQLAGFGGLEIVETIDRLASAPTIDIAGMHRLADAVSGRDNEIRFDLLNTHMLDRLAEAASGAARQGDARLADALSRGWQDMLTSIREAETYNLDRRQHALTMIQRLHDTLRM